jgi:hypothetical protein
MLIQEGVNEEPHGGMAMSLLNKYIAMLHVARQDFLKGNLLRKVARERGRAEVMVAYLFLFGSGILLFHNVSNPAPGKLKMPSLKKTKDANISFCILLIYKYLILLKKLLLFSREKKTENVQKHHI